MSHKLRILDTAADFTMPLKDLIILSDLNSSVVFSDRSGVRFKDKHFVKDSPLFSTKAYGIHYVAMWAIHLNKTAVFSIEYCAKVLNQP